VSISSAELDPVLSARLARHLQHRSRLSQVEVDRARKEQEAFDIRRDDEDGPVRAFDRVPLTIQPL
jgi:hypothetical protein